MIEWLFHFRMIWNIKNLVSLKINLKNHVDHHSKHEGAKDIPELLNFPRACVLAGSTQVEEVLLEGFLGCMLPFDSPQDAPRRLVLQTASTHEPSSTTSMLQAIFWYL